MALPARADVGVFIWLPMALPSQKSTSAAGSGTGKLRSSTALTKVKMLTLAAMPSASVTTTMPVNAGLRSRLRVA